MSASFDFDVLVVGSGFGGSVSALRLVEKGYAVGVVEKGKRWRTEDFPTSNWIAHKYLWAPRLLCHGIQKLTLLRDVLVLSGVGVGGGSLVYANTLLVPPEPFFQDPQWAGMADWRAELTPHYETARRMLGVAKNPRLFKSDAELEKLATERGFAHTFMSHDVGVYFGESGVEVPDPYFDGEGPARTGCTMCGGCMVGCRHGAKNTLDKNYLHLAEKRGARVIPETEITRIEPLDGGGYRLHTRRSTSALFGFFGGTGTLTAHKVVLAGGVLGTVPLLMRCREAGTLPHLSPALGHRCRTNSEAILGLTTRDDQDHSMGVAITSGAFVDDHTHIELVRYPRGSDVMGLLATVLTDGGRGVPRALRWLANIARRPVDFLRTLWPLGWAQRTVILLVMQTLDNSMRLVWTRKWWWPFDRRMTSTTDGRPSPPSYIPIANESARTLAERMNGVAQSAINEVLLDVPTTAHILGGCAVGPDSERGVIDANHEVYGHPGLFVCDGSAIPANLGVNPSLTITAMTERAMSRFPAKPS